jgi:L-ascorbate metabolism protein UlaG (beta-lactamase superfamily)
MKLHFHGQSCWAIHEGRHRLLIDPFLTDNPLADVGPEAFEKLDAIVVTHGHFDHIQDVEAIARATGALVVSNYEISDYFGAKGCKTHPMHIGGGREFPFGHVKFTIAQHGSTGPGGEALGCPMGVVLTMGGKKVYHAGDTGIFLDMKLIAELNGPLDVALLPIGDNFTMGIDDATKAAEFLQARVTIPMHYNTFPLIEVDPTIFVGKLADQGQEAVVVDPGADYNL